MKVKIFISYCHTDIPPSNPSLNVFTEMLRDQGKGTYDILVDYSSHEVGIGANLPKYMNQIDSADACIILLSEGYRNKVAKKGSTGVYYEFQRIYNRLLKAEEQGTYLQNFLLLPIVFAGNNKDSCPVEISHLLNRDLTWLHVIPGSNPPQVRSSIKAKLNSFVSEIKERITAVAVTKGQVFFEKQRDLFQNFLLQDTKSRWDNPQNKRYLNTAFVKTSTFRRVYNREVSFIIGRKGAGKSTITHVLPLLLKPPPSEVISIDFEHIAFNMCFNFLLSNPAADSDSRNAFSILYSYQLLWDTFLHLFFAWKIRKLLSPQSKIKKTLNKLFPKILTNNVEVTEENSTATRILFVHAFEQLFNFINIVMSTPRNEYHLSKTVADFSFSGFRNYVFGEKSWKEIQNVLTANQQLGNNILITADGFDVMVGYFTTEVGNVEKAKKFIRDLILSLFQIVLNKGTVKSSSSKLYLLSNFCIAIPHDRFVEVISSDRDRYNYRHKSTRINWSGIELSALLRKRLALLRDVKDTKGSTLEERLAIVMKKGYPELPNEVSFQFNSAPHHMPLFIYILRHTFWRPRDILFYYATLLAASEESLKNRKEVSSSFIRQAISGASRSVLEDEFYDEFVSSFHNLREVMQLFRHGDQVLNWAELKKTIGQFRFLTNLNPDETASLEWKVELLYDIGAIGVILERSKAESLQTFHHAFSFNEERFLTEKLRRDDYPKFNYAIHPIFCEPLHLDTSKNPELILPFDWEYLHANEGLRRIRLP